MTQYQVPRPDASPALRQPPQASMPPRDFEQWEVAMHDLARDLSGQLDSKIRILELLIREADKAPCGWKPRWRARAAAASRRGNGSSDAARRTARNRRHRLSANCDTRAAAASSPERGRQAAVRPNLRLGRRRPFARHDRQSNRQPNRRSRIDPGDQRARKLSRG